MVCLDMENAFYMWFMQKRSKYVLISEEVLTSNAIKFHQKNTKKYNVCASFGSWDKFGKQFSTRSLTVSGKKLSVQPFI